MLTKKIGVKRVGDRELYLKMASENAIFPLARPFARKYRWDEGLFYNLPMPVFSLPHDVSYQFSCVCLTVS